MAGSASTMPVSARGVGRSPNSSPASTENPAEATALSGPATLNAACLNPRYSANAPSVPPSPAAKPQASAAIFGPGEAAKGSAAATITALTTEMSSVIWMTGALREASPAAKSEPPYPIADASARTTASTWGGPGGESRAASRDLLGRRAAGRVEDPEHPQRLRAGVLQAVWLQRRQVDRRARPDRGVGVAEVHHALPGQHVHHLVIGV